MYIDIATVASENRKTYRPFKLSYRFVRTSIHSCFLPRKAKKSNWKRLHEFTTKTRSVTDMWGGWHRFLVLCGCQRYHLISRKIWKIKARANCSKADKMHGSASAQRPRSHYYKEIWKRHFPLGKRSKCFLLALRRTKKDKRNNYHLFSNCVWGRPWKENYVVVMGVVVFQKLCFHCFFFFRCRSH